MWYFYMANISSTYSSKKLNITQAARLSIIIVVLIYLDGNEAKCKQRYPLDPPIESARIKLTTKQPKTTRKLNDSKHLSYDNIDS